MHDTTNPSTTARWASQAGPFSVAVTGLLAAAAIHFSVVAEHLHEWAPFGIALGVLGFVEAVLAVAVSRRPSRRTWVAVGAVSAATVALWAVTRTTGLPVGPTPWHAEAVGRADTIATVAELVTLAAAVRALAGRRHLSRHPRLIAATALAVAVPLTFIGLSTSGAEMAASASPTVAPSSPAMATGAPMAGSAGTAAPPMASGAAVDSTTCPNLGGLMPMADGMVMQPMPDRAPTPAEQHAADALVAATRADTQRFASLAAAQAAGYVPETNPNARVVHWIDPAVVRAKDVLDPTHPSALIYVNSVSGPVLAGSMYLSAGPCQPGPDPAGPLFHWHAHANLCFATGGQVVGHTDASGQCTTGRPAGTTSFMLHVWTAPSLGDPLQPELPSSAYAQIIRTGRP